jgi:hypothetical protein
LLLFPLVASALILFLLKRCAEWNASEWIRLNDGGYPINVMTDWLYRYGAGYLALLLPWFVYAAVVIYRRSAGCMQLAVFSSTLLFTLVFVCVVSGAVFVLTWDRAYDSGGDIRPERLIELVRAAESGDARANYRLSHHYGFHSQRELSERYLRKAADLGDPSAKASIEAQQKPRPRATR